EAAEVIPRCFGVGQATVEELDEVAAAIAACRPRAYVEALDLGGGHLDLAQARHAWSMAGLEPERAVLVARDPSGLACAAAILDGLRPLSAPALCIAAAELVPDFIEHVFERTGPRPANPLNPLEAP